jgi:hypothetical protein
VDDKDSSMFIEIFIKIGWLFTAVRKIIHKDVISLSFFTN